MTHIYTPEQQAVLEDTRLEVIQSGLGSRYLQALAMNAVRLEGMANIEAELGDYEYLETHFRKAAERRRNNIPDEAPLFGFSLEPSNMLRSIVICKINPNTGSAHPHSTEQVGLISDVPASERTIITPRSRVGMTVEDVKLAASHYVKHRKMGINPLYNGRFS